ncbi:cyclin-dependent kinase 2-associated protein 1 [Condylostylus longicornis]|uniref:cyclin-dependent kinase 2-associated protein 1 n=1 Tax=Condylostylus longicornis TaxID=2530218 RepID=UPI00244E0D09|nr:cyclin-dependent kinase 2-associated protein 1 [Condylostylus longicornis]
MDAMDIQAVESKLSDVTVTPIPMSATRNSNLLNHRTSTATSYQQQLPQIQISAVPKLQSTTLQSAIPLITSSNRGSSSSNIDSLSSTTIGPATITTTSGNITTPMTSTANIPANLNTSNGLSKYAQLLSVIEEMGRDIRPTYTGSRNSTERLKRGIVHARILVRECLMETERSARQ